jgi:hypothetical protein
VASQRISADGLVDCLVSTFSLGAINEFKGFLAKYPLVTKWIIASDFVLNEREAASDAYAYTFFPYVTDLMELQEKISKLVPKDFKKTKSIGLEFEKFLHSGETFTVCLLTPKKFRAAGDLHTVRASLDLTLTMMRNWHDADSQKKVISAFERLKERTKANNFNAQLMSTIMISTVLAAFCAIILAVERKIETVGWFPDRDNITTAYDRIADYMFSVNLSAFCQRHGIDARQIMTVIGTPDLKQGNSDQMWFNELIRIPDFLAGPLAGWDYRKNLVTGRQKYIEILQGVVADNPYLITLILAETESGIGVSRLICSRSPIRPVATLR